MSITSRFKFIGEVSIPREAEKFLREWTGGKDGKTPMKSISFGVSAGRRNSAYVKLFGMKTNSIRTMDTNNKKIEIPWEQRFDEDIVKSVSFNRKYTVNLTERIEFISSYDMIEYLAEHLPQYEGKVFVTGTWRKNPYNGKIGDEFEITNIYAASPDEKSKLSLTMDYFYNSDCVDMSDFKSDKKIRIDGFIEQYDRDRKENVYFPQSVVLSAENYDFEKEGHVKKWDNMKKYAVDDLSKRKMKHLTWECRYVNGSEEVEFNESMLTDKQREQIELGFRDLEYFRPKNSIYGDKVTEVRLFAPILTGMFADGLVDCDETAKEFEERTFSFAPIEKIEDVLEAATVEEDSDEEDLF